METALRCWRSGSYVTISYRRAVFDETAIKHWLLPDINTQIRQGNIGFLPETRPIEIHPGSVTLERIPDGSRFSVQTDFVLLNTGFTADTTLYEKAGVNLLGTEKSPEYDPETMETNVPGLYVAGTTAAGSQSSYLLFIENTHVHVGKIIKSLTRQWPKLLGTIPSRQYDVPLEEIRKN